MEQFINCIICGDCLEVMAEFPPNSIDLIVTDPPYGLSYNQNDMASRWEAIFGGNVANSAPRPIANDGEEEANQLFRSMLREAARILKPGRCCCCCCCGGGPKPLFARWTLWMDEFLQFKQAIVWDKGGLGMGHHYRRNYEFMLVAQKPGSSCVWNGGRTQPNVIRIGKIIPQADEHPTAKPVKLMKQFIHLHSNPGDIVLDPFCGHGPTLQAAKELGRNYIGIEINEEYCQVARIRAEGSAVPLFEMAY